MNGIALAFRTFRKRPSFALLAVVLISLGIGASTAIFSIVNSVLLRPLPFKDPNRLTMILSRNQRVEGPSGAVSFDDFSDFRKQNDSFESVAATTVQWSFTLSTTNGAEQIFGLWASENLFSMLGVHSAAGRTFSQDEDQSGGAPVVVLSSEFARQRFGSEQRALNNTLRLDGRNYVVIGVMPPAFTLLDRAALWLPLQQNPFRTRGRGTRILNVFGRLKHRVTVTEADAGIQVIARRLEQEYPTTNRAISAAVHPLHEQITGHVRVPLLTADSRPEIQPERFW